MRTSYTVSEIAQYLGGKVVGESSHVITGVASIDTAKSNEITFYHRREYLDLVDKTQAGAILLDDPSIEPRANAIYVDDVRSSYPVLLGLFAQKVGAYIDPPTVAFPSEESPVLATGCFVAESAQIGPRTIVSTGAIVATGCRIGADCVIGPQVVLYENTVVGDRVEIGANSVIGADGFGYRRDGDSALRHTPHCGSVEIGDDVSIGACCVVDRAVVGATRIGNGTKIDNLVQIGHGAKLGRDVLVIGQSGIAGSAVIGDECRIFGQAGIAGHVVLGRGTTVLAGSLVSKSFSGNEQIAGVPAVKASRWRRMVSALRLLSSGKSSQRKK
nr:UDP-3-O-(3-hydroxymyristoyl)glucosamine N-acyltransferase [Nitrosomonas nitrosa]